MKASVRMAMILTLCCAATVAGATEAENLFATSNFWGVSISLYRTNVEESVSACQDAAALREWFGALCRYDEFPVSETDTAWMEEKGHAIMRYASIPEIAASTNCWFDAADFLGRLLGAESSDSTTPVTNVVFSTESECLAYIDERHASMRMERSRRQARKAAIRETRHAVADVFPWFILPRLAPDFRLSVISNVSERALIDVEDVGVLVRRRLGE